MFSMRWPVSPSGKLHTTLRWGLVDGLTAFFTQMPQRAVVAVNNYAALLHGDFLRL